MIDGIIILVEGFIKPLTYWFRVCSYQTSGYDPCIYPVYIYYQECDTFLIYITQLSYMHSTSMYLVLGLLYTAGKPMELLPTEFVMVM
jgi:hypothetical protein